MVSGGPTSKGKGREENEKKRREGGQKGDTP